MMELWLVYSLMAILFYGVGQGLSKEPTTRLGPAQMLFLYTFYSATIYGGWFILFRGWEMISAYGLLIGILAGLCGSLGYVLFYEALARGEAPIVGSVTASYPVIVVAASLLVLGAQVTILQLLGVFFLLVSVISLCREEERLIGLKGRWVYLMLLCVLVWGLWAVFEKIAIDEMGFAGNAGAYALSSTPIYLGYWAWKGKARMPRNPRLVFDAQPTLMLYALGGVATFFAFGYGDLAIVAPLTASYPVVTVLYRRFVRHDTLPYIGWIAVCLAIAGTILASMA